MFAKYFGGSALFAIVALIVSAIVGMFYGNPLAALVSAALLGIIETCLSFDNAIVNSSTLKTMSPEWRHRFLTWGMVVAVFGMRLLFPVLIVSVASHINPWAAVHMALFDPKQYEASIVSAHTSIMAFGGTFLMMVALKFFLDANKDEHWLAFIERHLVSIGKIESVQAAAAIVAVLLTYNLMEDPKQFFTAGLLGIVGYILVDGIGAFLGAEDGEAGVAVAKAGIASFLYLEVLDASFSFDGVIAAFAITNNFLIIALGLGIGAMFVRSLTLYLVDTGKLEQFAYLEHGAFYAIAFLVVVMFMSAAGHDIGELATAGGSLLIIGTAFLHSLVARKDEAQSQAVVF